MRTALAAVLASLVACASAPKPVPAPPGSRGLRASDHLEAAQQHDQQAREQLAYPEVRSGATGRVDEAPYAVPWTRTWDARADHERLAQIHRGAAAQLHAEYEEACGARSAADAGTSPIERFAIGGSPTATGAVIYLSAAAGDPDKLLADMRCHRAWMMLAPSDMDSCPLDLDGIQVTARGNLEGIEVTITIADPALVPELQRRASLQVEHAHHGHHGGTR